LTDLANSLISKQSQTKNSPKMALTVELRCPV